MTERDDIKSMEKIILENIDVPSIPPLAAKVLQLVESDYTSLNELENIISKDQSFSSRVLKIANSPYYGKKNISRISDAISFIGFNAMKLLVVGATLRDFYSRHNAFENVLWEHSLGVSIAASLLAMETKLVQPEEALVAGLIHDIGKAVLNHSIPEAYSEVINMAGNYPYSFLEAENIVLGYDHCNVGGTVSRAWNLPLIFEAVIEHHHSRKLPEYLDAAHRDICELVKISDAMCLNSGIGLKKSVSMSGFDTERMGLTEERIKDLTGILEKNYKSQRDQLLD